MKPYHYWIPYNRPNHFSCVSERDGEFLGVGLSKGKCEKLLLGIYNVKRVFLTPSCSASLEMAALAMDLQPGDEIILPSFTFVTSASAFALRGAKLVFVDIRPDTLNINESLIEDAITIRTKAVVVVHYGGVASEMSSIVDICKRYNLVLVEDAAQSIMSTYKGQPLGSIGQFGCVSFHHTKNIHAGGEGGAFLVNEDKYHDICEIIQEKGTDRSRFLRGEVDKYTWQILSSSYVMSELQALVLLQQLQKVSEITKARLQKWIFYHACLSELANAGVLTLPAVPAHVEHNAHIYHIRARTPEEQQRLFRFMRNLNVEVTSHFVPLHSSPAGIRYGRFHGDDINTTAASKMLLRLPLHASLTESEQAFIIDAVRHFFVVNY
ncbi:dTDP-4-amino-4,6-dideoxygalactose transaminase [Aeromonas dhakensis]|uniref:dTDP-4-amino-4,6-dideoxygalactose transaminase n=1 Tax=Aeromonas dhakensis TaxID=196024 RepID=UPI00191EC6C6|nr:dTDP-4-amino-4,6-dideoxygalactose transaminase [Aeromonas dhakensis]MBL0676343.1 dTDP-4-amino-4,6-dideoxygalactose transaminase [Aeromonas dhakensis]MDX7742863.1 dTDP-4-amino-4,6-dideoxygalactose transaminase [Aeromonas dhakensis]